jgi:hypothetical protein
MLILNLENPISGISRQEIKFGIIEKQAEDPLPLGGGMNAVPTAFETGAK